jgi:N-acetylglutamate synthase-like GNAT family acetyltransferase
VAQVTPDAGPVAVYPDAGLVEMGAAQCEMVIARVIACPSVGAEMKKDLEKKRVEIRQLAVDPKNRESLAAACRQLVEAMEETLRRLSC